MVTAMCSSGLCFWYFELRRPYQRPAWGRGGDEAVGGAARSSQYATYMSCLTHCLNRLGCPGHPQVQHHVAHHLPLARASVHTQALHPHTTAHQGAWTETHNRTVLAFADAPPTTTATPPTCSLRGVLCRRCWCNAFLVSSQASSVFTRGEEAWLTGSVSSDSPLNFPSNTTSWPLRGGKPRPDGTGGRRAVSGQPTSLHAPRSS